MRLGRLFLFFARCKAVGIGHGKCEIRARAIWCGNSWARHFALGVEEAMRLSRKRSVPGAAVSLQKCVVTTAHKVKAETEFLRAISFNFGGDYAPLGSLNGRSDIPIGWRNSPRAAICSCLQQGGVA